MGKELSGRVWRFGNCEFDEGHWELRVDGERVEVETKQLEVLLYLLLHKGDIVTQDELKRALWSGSKELEDFPKPLFTAISRLRGAIHDSDKQIVVTVPKYGYRFAAPVTVELKAAEPVNDFSFAAGDTVPGRENWELKERLGASPFNEVWRAEHKKTHEVRVFKMAVDGVMLQALRREATLSRYFVEAAEESGAFVRVLDFQFEAAPFLLESAYGGPDLTVWANTQGGLANVPLATRRDIMRQVARAVGIAHGLGVLHKDLKPGNVLITAKEDGGWAVKVADFGSAIMIDAARLSDFGISGHGFLNQEDNAGRAGTWMYAAPEIKKKDTPTAQADIYSLGVMLYQMVVADFGKPLTLGWEADVPDPILQGDIAEAAHGAPLQRLSSAIELSERLATVEERRAVLQAETLKEEEARGVHRKLAEARARRPWVLAAVVLLVAGLCASVLLSLRTLREKKDADEQRATAQGMLAFLTENVIGRADPFRSKTPEPTLSSAILRASGEIDQRFRTDPLTAGKLHLALANAFDNRTRYADATGEYKKAIAAFARGGAADNQDRWLAMGQFTTMEARSLQPGGAERSVALLKQLESETHTPMELRDDVRFWLLTGQGVAALATSNIQGAINGLNGASQLAQRSAHLTEREKLGAQQKLMVAEFKAGDVVKAEQLCKRLIVEFGRVDGPNSPYVLTSRMNLAQIDLNTGRYADAVRETTEVYPKLVARLGERNAFSLQVLATRAAAEGSAGDYEHSI
ncbi:MAG: winged helix-turn-helix domain-containing protein [Acidobacteriota bacterium]|nr:winged helix-turn-helix domain-containing protein [Acidobacteriota bacterium]